MAIIPEDELEDAMNAAEEYGYRENEFAFSYKESAPLRGGPAPIVAEVEVTDTTSGISKKYDAGSGSTWPADFDGDVKSGIFGPVIGKRRVRPWQAVQMVDVRRTPESDVYRARPVDGGDDFAVIAKSDSELLDSIVKELRRRNPKAD